MSSLKGKSFFGPPMWKTLHCVATTYTPDKAGAFINLLNSYTELLPCETCRENLKKKIIAYPPTYYLNSNHDLFFYTYMLHDLANKDINSHHNSNKISPPFITVKSEYFSALGESCKECKR